MELPVESQVIVGLRWLVDSEATGVAARGASLVGAPLVADDGTPSMPSEPAEDVSGQLHVVITNIRRRLSCSLIHPRGCTPCRIVCTAGTGCRPPWSRCASRDAGRVGT